MNYALGPFSPDRDAALTALVQLVPLLPPGQLAQRLRDHHVAGKVDLLATLEPGDPDRQWLESVCETMRQLVAEGRHVALLECSRVRGAEGVDYAVALVDRALTDTVRPGDSVQAGVAILRAPACGLVAVPRVFRKLCSNGAVLDIGCATGREIEPYEIDAAVRGCLQPGSFEAMVGRLRWAAHEVVFDGPALLAAARPRSASGALLARWRQQGDRSLWGLVNAATSLAHAEASWAERLELERDAERLLGVGLERGSVTVAEIAAMR